MNGNMDGWENLPAERARYESQVLAMSAQASKWLMGHPASRVLFQQPVQGHQTSSLASALDTSMASCSPDARLMFLELGWLQEAPGHLSPTPFMVRMALELCLPGATVPTLAA